MSVFCYCTTCIINNPSGSLVSYGTRSQHERNDLNRASSSAIRERTAAANHDMATSDDDGLYPNNVKEGNMLMQY